MPGAPLLQYTATSSPAPLQPDGIAINKVDVTVSVPTGQTVYCEEIMIAVPASAPDDGGPYFTEEPQSSIIGGDWQPPESVRMRSGQELGLAAATQYYQFPFYPPVPGMDLLDGDLEFQISGALTATTGGPLTFWVTETSHTPSDRSTRKDPVEMTLPTAQPGAQSDFFLRSFLATAPDTPGIPRTKFDAGDGVRFSWESNGTSYTLYDGDGTVLYEGTQTSWSTTQKENYKILNDTTFTVRASTVSGADESTQYATLTVTIGDPSLLGLTVGSEGIGVTGPLNAGSIGAKDVTVHDGGSLYVYGRAGFEEGLQVSGDTAISGDLSVEGKVSLNALFQPPVQLEPVVTDRSTQNFYVEYDGILVIQNPPDSTFWGTFSAKLGPEGGDDDIWLDLMGDRMSYTVPLRQGQEWAIYNLDDDVIGRLYWITFRQ
ncbi:hypothetical protein ABGB17_33605 [Sphaerisporangium sp. B11E5]|uniref:hypothetical protein n=1 Tax=Sphaerisporangium sp. B11E5 TaxID=3153563 RepID=UPI00325E77A9